MTNPSPENMREAERLANLYIANTERKTFVEDVRKILQAKDDATKSAKWNGLNDALQACIELRRDFNDADADDCVNSITAILRQVFQETNP